MSTTKIIREKINKLDTNESFNFEPTFKFTKYQIPLYLFISTTLSFIIGLLGWSFLFVVGLLATGTFIFNKRITRLKNKTLKLLVNEQQIENMSDVETVRWLNLALKRVWEVYEHEFCLQITGNVNQILLDSKPGFIVHFVLIFIEIYQT